MRRCLLALILGAAAAWGGPAAAQTVLQLAATGSVQAAPDQITASLTVQASAASAAGAQNKVNQAMGQALAAARTTAGVSATTAGYNVQDTSAKQNGTQFQASQGLNLVMPAADGVPPDVFRVLLGRLQGQDLLLNGLDGGLSADGRVRAQDAAIAEAIHRLQDQAAVVGKTLGQHVGGIKTLNISVDNAGPVMPMMAMAMARDAAPQAAPGPVTVTASVSGEITLLP